MSEWPLSDLQIRKLADGGKVIQTPPRGDLSVRDSLLMSILLIDTLYTSTMYTSTMYTSTLYTSTSILCTRLLVYVTTLYGTTCTLLLCTSGVGDSVLLLGHPRAVLNFGAARYV